MFKGILQSAVILTATLMMCLGADNVDKEPINTSPITETREVKMEEYRYVPTEFVKSSSVVVEPEPSLSEEDMELIALVTMAEAEGESEKGKRLVISTILNRMDSEHFPDTAYDVIYQKSQFTSMHNGRVDRCHVDPDIYRLVEEEVVSRTDTDVIFFHAGRYSQYGERPPGTLYP